MTPAARREYVRAVRPRYTLARASAKPQILDEFCATTGYHRKYAISLLNHPAGQRPSTPAHGERGPTYSGRAITCGSRRS